MNRLLTSFSVLRVLLAGVLALALAACASSGNLASIEDAPVDARIAAEGAPEYLIGPLDELEVFVWRAPELSTKITVRPDGRISTPLVEDMAAAGKTPTQLAADIETALADFVKTPEVTVIVSNFSSTFEQQVRVLGQAQKPAALPYQAGMTVLDVMVSVGGLTEYAAGDRAILIRGQGAEKKEYKLKLNSLLKKGDISANAPVMPGDVILIPESVF